MRTTRSIPAAAWCAALILLLLPIARAAELKIVPGPYRSGKALLPATFDGVKARCMLDTGSALTVVESAGSFERYQAEGSIDFKSASGRQQATDTIRVGEIRFAGGVFTNVSVSRLHNAAENMLGIDLIARQPFSMTFIQVPSLHLNPPAPRSLQTDLAVSKHGLMAVPLKLAGVQVSALWDTGASITVVDPRFIQAHPADFHRLSTPMLGTDGAGDALEVAVYRARRMAIGGRTFRNMHVVAVDLSMLREHFSQDIQAVLGFNVIRKADWYFHRANRQWSIR